MLGLGRLIPRDQEFFTLFNQLSAHLTTTARLLNELFENPTAIGDKVKAIKAVEHRADLLTLDINSRIARSFVTPFDREDIHSLTTRMDDVIDLLDGTARRVEMLHITQMRPPARQLSKLLVEAAEHIERGVNGIKRPKDVSASAIEVKRIEEEGDSIYHEAVGELFQGTPDPLEVIRWKEIYDVLEETTDRCMGVVHALQEISMKNV